MSVESAPVPEKEGDALSAQIVEHDVDEKDKKDVPNAFDLLRAEFEKMKEDNARELTAVRAKHAADMLEMRARVGWLEKKVKLLAQRKLGHSKVCCTPFPRTTWTDLAVI